MVRLFVGGIIAFGLFVSAAGIAEAQWTQTSEPSYANVSALLSSGTYLFAGLGDGSMRGGGVYVSTDNGASWYASDDGLKEAAYGSDTMDVVSLGIIGSRILAGTYYGGPYTSDGWGNSWTQSSTGMTDTNGAPLGVPSFVVDGSSLLAGTFSLGVYVSIDSGRTWTADSSGLPGANGIYSTVNALAVSGNNLFAGTNRGLYESTNDGQSWAPAQSPMDNYYIMAFAKIGAELFAAGGGLFRSSDNGMSWTNISSYDFTSLAVDGTELFASELNSGVYLSTDSGMSFTPVNTGLSGSAQNVNALSVSGGYLIAGTQQEGVWRRAISEMVTAVRGPGGMAPRVFSLEQNFPNPFNPTTTINYKLPRNVHVSLEVYDMLGRRVAVLVNEREDAGSYSVTFNGSGLASGVYIYRLEAGSFVSERKLAVVK